VSLAVLSDAGVALHGIATRLRAMQLPARGEDDLSRYRALDEQVQIAQATPDHGMTGPGIPPAHAIGTIGAVFGREAVYTVAGGNTLLWAYSFLPRHAHAPTTRSWSWECSALESPQRSAPSSAGATARFCTPHRRRRRRLQHHGDAIGGGEKLAITTIVFAEGSWTMEQPNELALYGKTFGTAQGEIRWDLVAEGLGCHSEYIDRLEDLEPALRPATRWPERRRPAH
jgi:acetolactate synthase-1/2/3 large subunit